ncbi:hypothetical protein [Mycobacterium asiaticum]|uniref:Uncharacterized protein n=1 Tax=Mycobacterium asiaticum TaxID=1790 RepID=A0A1A3D052_MYCAS|nr:hypothetical protein [Mycobacterium asiaticum]OBI92378.1 hypothetical protein A9X01_09475 [Mycobacterium asiaticum]
MAPLLAACGGFLLAVLWMDLIFDVQVFRAGPDGGELPEPVLASIAAYYHRATTTSRPMGRLIALVMLILLSALVIHALNGGGPAWLLLTSAALAGVPVALAMFHTVPSAVRLGKRRDTAVGQSRLARVVCRDHLICFGCLLAFTVLWSVHGVVLDGLSDGY